MLCSEIPGIYISTHLQVLILEICEILERMFSMEEGTWSLSPGISPVNDMQNDGFSSSHYWIKRPLQSSFLVKGRDMSHNFQFQEYLKSKYFWYLLSDSCFNTSFAVSTCIQSHKHKVRTEYYEKFIFEHFQLKKKKKKSQAMKNVERLYYALLPKDKYYLNSLPTPLAS